MIEMEEEGKKAMKKLAKARAERMAKARKRTRKAEAETAKPGYNPGRLIEDFKDYKGPKPWSMKKARRMNRGLNK